MVIAAELARHEPVLPVRQHQRRVRVPVVEKSHVVPGGFVDADLAVDGGAGVVHQRGVFAVGGLDDDDECGELFRVREGPVRAWHCYLCGRQEEELVHVVEDGCVRVDVDYAVEFRFAEGEKLRDTFVPWFVGFFKHRN